MKQMPLVYLGYVVGWMTTDHECYGNVLSHIIGENVNLNDVIILWKRYKKLPVESILLVFSSVYPCEEAHLSFFFQIVRFKIQVLFIFHNTFTQAAAEKERKH